MLLARDRVPCHSHSATNVWRFQRDPESQRKVWFVVFNNDGGVAKGHISSPRARLVIVLLVLVLLGGIHLVALPMCIHADLERETLPVIIVFFYACTGQKGAKCIKAYQQFTQSMNGQ